MKKSTRNWILIGTVGAAGLLIWYIMKGKSSSGMTADQMAAAGIDPTTGVPYSEEYAGYGGYGASGVVPSLYGYIDPTTGAFISGAGAGGNVIAPSTNASWAQQVEAYLSSIGYNAVTVAAAIGKYLTGQTLSADEAAIVAAALGFFGQPPQGAPPIHTTPPPGQNPPPTGNGTRKSGFYTCSGKKYYYHSHPRKGSPYWTLNGRRVSTPSCFK